MHFATSVYAGVARGSAFLDEVAGPCLKGCLLQSLVFASESRITWKFRLSEVSTGGSAMMTRFAFSPPSTARPQLSSADGVVVWKCFDDTHFFGLRHGQCRICLDFDMDQQKLAGFMDCDGCSTNCTAPPPRMPQVPIPWVRHSAQTNRPEGANASYASTL